MVEWGATTDSAVPAIVLGVGPSALGVVRCLGRAGVRPYLVCRSGDFAGRSRWARSRVVRLDDHEGPDQLMALRERLGFDRAVLIPCTDVWSQAVASLPEAARDHFATSTPTSDAIELLIDKLLFAEALERFDVPHPRTRRVETERDLDGPLDGFFLKPRHSQLFAERYRRKALTFEGEQEARDAFKLIADVGLTAVLQEFIPGPPTAHYFIDGFMGRDGRVAALFGRRRIRMFPIGFGNSTLTVSVELKEVQPAADSLVRLLSGIGYRGVFSAEFKYDERDGLFKLLEVNSRPWWYIEFASLCGVDVSVLAYRDALGLELPTLDHYAIGERCVFLPGDIQAFWVLRRTDGLSLFAWLRSWVGARPMIFAWSDPLPALAYLRRGFFHFWQRRRTPS